MLNDSASSSVEADADITEPTENSGSTASTITTQRWYQIWESLVRMGLGETTLRIGTGVISVFMIVVVLWVMSNFYLKDGSPAAEKNVAQAAALPSPTPTPVIPVFDLAPEYYGAYMNGITRLAQIHTIFPSRPRFDVSHYIVEEGDTIFDIADKFNLSPETILWGNIYTLGDDPHRLKPGQSLVILPVDGVYYEWHAGDGLNGVADFYGVTSDAIIDWPGNYLDRQTLGDLAFPNIDPGTWLVIPGGEREFVTWSAPRITRDDPAVAKIFGEGACDAVYEGPIGSGTFIWPTIEKYLSGYDYSTETNHYGIDIAGKEGYAIFAVDAGVVVYSGWNDWGYGNVVVIDHGNGWQSLYAHLSNINVGCGDYVYQGDIIAGLGNTGNSSGPHLHFELRSDQYGRPNPWNFLSY